MIVLDRASWQTMPWANGGGITHEVMVEPAGATTDDFDWRISVAEVREPGSFSSLPGIDRLLLLVGGSGMSLQVDGEIHEASPELPLSFRGESQAACVRLADGPTLDLNVMTRRGRWVGSIDVVAAGAVVQCAEEDRVVVFELDSLNAVFLDAGESVLLATRSAVVRLQAGSSRVAHTLEVRPAFAHELTAAGDVAAHAYAHGSPENAEAMAYSEIVRATVANPNPGPVLVAIRGDEVVGTATVCPAGSPHSELALAGELEFRFLAVSPVHRGTGVAQALLEAVLAHGRTMGAESAVCFVIEWNERAHRLYRSRGFTRMPSRDWRPIPGVLLQAYSLPLQ